MKRFLFTAIAAVAAVFASTTSADAAFSLRFDFVSGSYTVAPNPPVTAPEGPFGSNYVIASEAGPAAGVFSSTNGRGLTVGINNPGGVIDLWDNNVDVGANIRLTYTVTNNAATGELIINTTAVTWNHNNPVAQLDPVRFILTVEVTDVFVLGNPGDPTGFYSDLSVQGGAGNAVATSASFSQAGVGTITASSPGFIPVSPIPLTPAMTAQVLVFNRGTGTGTFTASAEHILLANQNTTLGATLRLQGVVPAPAGIVLAACAVPALGLLRLRRRQSVQA